MLNQAVVSNISTPTTTTESLCKIHYAQQRRSTLRSHPWNFAIKRIQLAKDATAPLFGFGSAYNLPTDFIRFLTRHNELGEPVPGNFIEGVDYQIEDGQFLTNGVSTTSGVLNMRYIYDQENISSWDPLALDTFVLNLALAMAPKFKSNIKAVATLETRLRETKAEAKAIDGQERPPRRVQNSKFISARRHRSSTVASKFTIFE